MTRRRCACCAAWIYLFLSGTASAQPSDCTLAQAAGFTEPAATVEIAAREPGIVAKVLVEVGDRVKAGEILAELDKTLALAELDSARARAAATGRLEAAEAKFDHASRRSEEIAKLEAARAARPLELIAAKAEMAVARAELRAAKDDLHIAELDAASVEARLSLLDVRAPFDGVVNEVHRDVSELVGASGEARIVTLYELDRLHADFFVPAGCIGDVGKGTILPVKLERQDKSLPARVRNLGVEIDAPTGMRRISIEIDNPDYIYLGGERLVLALPVGGLER
ncbi:efflux RND transporter periplasmic adaptor subunit [Mesorhizobium xinjiangense]|uniref:efflux RND transporter periplasmic adaptor subunit n=1 Tax=Mesorhizobium xinjiangense TaxID=2678685 RepID=UPI0018DBB6CF|nr:efflux RND transporter periplasmic adaptor subunit [Mesorhizobium xinjiangense]